MMNEKQLTDLQNKTLKNVYRKQFEAAFQDAVADKARRDAERHASVFVKSPEVQKQIKKMIEDYMKKKLPAWVEKEIKDASICF